MKSDKNCPCGSNILFTECCAPIIQEHVKAKTAEQLMRARYTAFTMHENSFILETWAKESRPKEMNTEETVVKWVGLKVESVKDGTEQDNTGTVSFTASFIAASHLCHLWEKSRFIKEDSKWFYLDGTPKSSTEKIARNALCPCGSGKKIKRCCL